MPCCIENRAKSGCEVSILGFECMCLPIKNGGQRDADRFDPTKATDEEKATKLIDCRPCPQAVNIEIILGKAIGNERPNKNSYCGKDLEHFPLFFSPRSWQNGLDIKTMGLFLSE